MRPFRLDIHRPKRSLAPASYARSMERDTHAELEEVVTEAGVGVPPDKVRYRRYRCVRADPNVIAAADCKSGHRIPTAAPSAAGLGPRKPDPRAQEQTA